MTNPKKHSSSDDDCTKRKLNNFGLKHYTYINQMFGDEAVREIIQEVYPNKYLELRSEMADDRFDPDSMHHYVYDKAKNRKICSVDTRGYQYQNVHKNKNDTLCQSYSLLFYFDKKIPKTNKGRHMEMVKMYRDLIGNKTLMKKINDEIIEDKRNKHLWTDFTKRSGEEYVTMDLPTIVRHMNEVLNRWENYGYRYFIGEGTC